MRKSEEVTEYVKHNESIDYGLSVDVEDLFYSVPQDKLLVAVRKCIEQSGECDFQNSACLSVHNLTLLEFYLSVTFIVFNEQPFLQRRGVCIRSCVAPILCDIFLADIDSALDLAYNGGKVFKVFRYVDDFLIVLNKEDGFTATGSILDVFIQAGQGLSFTHELLGTEGLQFLDLRLKFSVGHVC